MLFQNINFPEGYVLAVDKPYTWTSTDVVRKIKIMLRKCGYPKLKVGHAGTLDPLATGILLVCIGKATKQAETLQNHPKTYIAEIELGATTPSYDLEKEIDARFPFQHITREMVENQLQNLVGEQLQVPPIFSAKSIDGKRAYEYARAGQEVEMRKALIEIYDARLLSFNLPRITVEISCSKGTYIRSIARDLGLSLDSGAHLTALRRTVSGTFRIEETLPLETIEQELLALQQLNTIPPVI